MAWESRRVDEYSSVLAYPEIAKRIESELLRTYHSRLFAEMEFVALLNISRVCRDPDDDKVMATALFGQADYLGNEDRDLQTQAGKAALARVDA